MWYRNIQELKETEQSWYFNRKSQVGDQSHFFIPHKRKETWQCWLTKGTSPSYTGLFSLLRTCTGLRAGQVDNMLTSVHFSWHLETQRCQVSPEKWGSQSIQNDFIRCIIHSQNRRHVLCLHLLIQVCLKVEQGLRANHYYFAQHQGCTWEAGPTLETCTATTEHVLLLLS